VPGEGAKVEGQVKMVLVFGLGQSQSCLLFQVICARLLAFVFSFAGQCQLFQRGV
jgi:hypothetical protein